MGTPSEIPRAGWQSDFNAAALFAESASRWSGRSVRCFDRIERGRLLHDDVCVRAAEAERADARDALAVPARPGLALGRDFDRQVRPTECSGLSVWQWRCGGISSCCSASTTLIRPAMPAAASRWPMLVLTEPISSGSSGARPSPQHRAQRLHFDRIAQRRAGAVRFDVADFGRLDAAARQRLRE